MINFTPFLYFRAAFLVVGLWYSVYDRQVSAGCGYRQLSPFENGLLALRYGLK